MRDISAAQIPERLLIQTYAARQHQLATTTIKRRLRHRLKNRAFYTPFVGCRLLGLFSLHLGRVLVTVGVVKRWPV